MNRKSLITLVTCLVVLFASSAVFAAPMMVDTDKSVMMAADKFLKMTPDNGFFRYKLEDLKMKWDASSMTGGMKDFVIIDVRPANAFAVEHIPMSMNVPLPMVIDKLSMIPTDKAIYVVCAVDSNSSYATAVLRMLGYNAYMVPGGEGAWKMAGYPLTSGM